MTSYRICTKCVMDTTVPDISFDNRGECNYCRQYRERTGRELHYDAEGQAALSALVANIKKAGTGKKYDCIIGVSGGVDSTYVAYLVKRRFGLRPLAIHLDNGWNSELAVENVTRTLRKLDIDLITEVLDWEEFKDIQVAFLKASIANAEIPTDHAIVATLFRSAAKMNVSYIITGSNIVTEAIMPESWMYSATDLRFIKGIRRRYGRQRRGRFPEISLGAFAYYIMGRRIRYIPLLNYVPYVKEEAKRLVERELGWADYGGKHNESTYTRFFQDYLLPKKFNIDKRRAHLSNLIVAGQLSREEVLRQLALPPCSSDELQDQLAYVLKKLDLSRGDFDKIMATPPKSVDDYPNSTWLLRRLSFVVSYARSLAIIHRDGA